MRASADAKVQIGEVEPICKCAPQEVTQQPPVQEDYDYTEYQQKWEQRLEEEPKGGQEQEEGQEEGSGEQIQQCPGGDLEAWADVCPGEFGLKVFGICVGSCGKRCP